MANFKYPKKETVHMSNKATMLEAIQNDLTAARRARDGDKVQFLSTLLSDVSMPGKNKGNRESTPKEVFEAASRFNGALDDMLKHKPQDERSLRERAWIAPYLAAHAPAMMSLDELRALIDAVQKSLGLDKIRQKNMGAMMSAIKAKADKEFDGAAASQMVKDAIAASAKEDAAEGGA